MYYLVNNFKGDKHIILYKVYCYIIHLYVGTSKNV